MVDRHKSFSRKSRAKIVCDASYSSPHRKRGPGKTLPGVYVVSTNVGLTQHIDNSGNCVESSTLTIMLLTSLSDGKRNNSKSNNTNSKPQLFDVSPAADVAVL